jgi:hypothetical protein
LKEKNENTLKKIVCFFEEFCITEGMIKDFKKMGAVEV